MGAMDDLRSQIKVRGLKQGGFSDPVHEFKGVFTGFDPEEAKFQGESTGRTNLVMHFAEVEVIASSEPYPFPNKDVSISYSESVKSRWGIFAESAIGRRLHLKTEVRKLFQGKERGEQPVDCWTVVGIEGVASGNGQQASSPISAEKQLLVLINGKTQQQFNMEALRLPAVKGDSALVTRILNATYFSELTGKGLVQKDDAGIYTLTAQGVEELGS